MDSISLIIGLGNPGTKYVQHRHNAGYWFIQMLAQEHGVILNKSSKLFGSLGKAHLAEGSLLLFQADSVFINQSGRALQAVSNFYRIPPENILVAHDEIDFPLAKVRLKQSGGHGGHNGLRDIINHIGADFWRLRIGVDHPGNKELVDKHVLSDAGKDEQIEIKSALQQIITLLPELYSGNFHAVMNTLHKDQV